MVIGSVCSGAGFMDLGFHRAGHRTAWFCEAIPYRRRVLERHFPGAPIYPDLTTLDPAAIEPVDLFVGGTPCQDLSVAGNRAGLDGERSGLFFDFIRIRDAIKPEWTVWENVAGAFSSDNGRDFAVVLGSLVGAAIPVPTDGWRTAGMAVGPRGSAAWRLLNAQWFGVPQRRRRVFVVAHLGGVSAAKVLFESTGGNGDPSTREEARADSPGTFGARIAGTLGGQQTRRGRPHRPRAERRDLDWIAGALDRNDGGADDNAAQANHIITDSGEKPSRQRSAY